MTRGSNGDSWVARKKSKDGRFHATVHVGTKEDGSRDRRHRSATTRAELVRKVRALEQQRDAGAAPSVGAGVTVGQWLEHWLENVAPRRVRPRTLESYESVVRLHLRPALGHLRLDRLQPEDVERLHTAMRRKGLSPATVLRAHRVLARALRVAHDRGRAPRNVCSHVEPPSSRASQVAQPLSAAEARSVLATAAGRRNGARWTVALALGLRQSEALGLQWVDIDLDAGRLAVRRGLHRVVGQGLTYEEPKSVRSRRVLTVPTVLVEQLRVQRERQEQERRAAGDQWDDHGLVFAQANGRPIDRRADHRAWRALLAEAGVRAVRLHDGRHTAATVLLEQRVPPRVVMELLGHAQMRTTTDTYSHVLPALAQEAADRMNEALLA